MRYLLDTHIVLCLAHSPDILSAHVRQILENSDLDVYFSAVNMWEIVIKNQLGKDDFRVNSSKLYNQLLTHGFIELPVLAKHTLAVSDLPIHYKDPFDRLLIAQASHEQLTLITHDQAIWQYDEIKLIKA